MISNQHLSSRRQRTLFERIAERAGTPVRQMPQGDRRPKRKIEQTLGDLDKQ